MDLQIYKGLRWRRDQKLDYRVYQKPFNAYSYIPYFSFHKKEVFSGLLTLEQSRYITHSSDITAYQHTLSLFRERISLRDYPEWLINDTLAKLDYHQDRANLLYPSPRSATSAVKKLLLITQYNPLTIAMNMDKLLHTVEADKVALLCSTSTTSARFMMAHRRPANLGSALRRKTSSKNEQPSDQS